MITHPAKEIGQQKKQWGCVLEVTGNWGGGWTKFEKGEWRNIGGGISTPMSTI